VQRGDIAWKTAINIWATATKMCGDAAESKIDALRCRPDDISRGVRGPDRGDDIGHQWLYPSELLRFVSCDDVPLSWRRIIALAVYLYPRDGELRALECRDLDVEHMSMSITKAAESKTGVVQSTKGKCKRSVTIEPSIVPLIKAVKAEKADQRAPFADIPSPTGMARGLRSWLLKAGVDRHELHHKTPTTRPIRFHDLRATGITWMAVRGDDTLKIQQRAGHAEFDTTQKYIREAEALREGFGVPFPELPKALFQTHTEPESRTPIAHAFVSVRKDRDDSACYREPNPPAWGRQCLTPAVPTVSHNPCNPIPPRH
jgi:integrase